MFHLVSPHLDPIPVHGPRPVLVKRRRDRNPRIPAQKPGQVLSQSGPNQVVPELVLPAPPLATDQDLLLPPSAHRFPLPPAPPPFASVRLVSPTPRYQRAATIHDVHTAKCLVSNVLGTHSPDALQRPRTLDVPDPRATLPPRFNGPLWGDPCAASRGSLAHLLRDRQLSGHRTYTEVHRKHLRSLHPRVLVPQTSGDVEAITPLGDSAFAIASVARPTVTENRSGNLLIANLALPGVWSATHTHWLATEDSRFSRISDAPARDPDSTRDLDAAASAGTPAVYCTVSVALSYGPYVLSASGSDHVHANRNGPEIPAFGQVRLTDLRTSQAVPLPAALANLPSRVTTSAQSPHWPQLVALGCDDGTVLLVNVDRLARGHRARTWEVLVAASTSRGQVSPGITALAFGSRDGAHLLVVGTDRRNAQDPCAIGPAALVVLDVRTLGVKGPWRESAFLGPVGRMQLDWPWSIASLAMDPVRGAYVYFATSEVQGSDRCVHRVALHDVRERSPAGTLAIDQSLFTDLTDVDVLALSPCGRFLVVGGSERHARVFDLSLPSRALALLPHEPCLTEENIYDTRWLHNTNLLVTVGGDGVVRFWDIPAQPSTPPTRAEAQLGSVSGKILTAWTLQHWADVTAKGYADDVPRKVLASARYAALVHNKPPRGNAGWAQAAPRPWHEVPIRKGLVSRVATSPDERTFVIGMEACAMALAMDAVTEATEAHSERGILVAEPALRTPVDSAVDAQGTGGDEPLLLPEWMDLVVTTVRVDQLQDLELQV